MLYSLTLSVQARIAELFRASRAAVIKRHARRFSPRQPSGGAEVLEERLLLTTVLVDDDGGGDFASINAAIQAAAAGDVIQINGGDDGIHTEADITIDRDVTIEGVSEPTQVIVQAPTDASPIRGIFEVESGVTATFENLTIRHGVYAFGAGIYNQGEITVRNSSITQNSGSAIGNYGTLTLLQSTISENSDNGLYNSGGTATIENSSIVRNSASGTGGGIYSNLEGIVTILDSLISENTSGSFGGGISSTGTLTIANSSITANTASAGGGGVFDLGGQVNITNSAIAHNVSGSSGGGVRNSGGSWSIINTTISQNSARTFGGGILNAGTLTVLNSTLTGNVANSENAFGSTNPLAGGLYDMGGTETIYNTIIAGNLSGISQLQVANDLFGGTLETVRHTLIGAANTTSGIVHGENGNIVGNSGSGVLDITTILDTTLKDNGGPTLTHALVSGSFALNAGDNSRATEDGTTTGTPLQFDQRGVDRIQNGTVDIGAFEAVPPVSLSITDITQNEDDGTMVFTLALDRAIEVDLTVDFTTIAGTVDENDFTPTSGTATISAGTLSTTISIEIAGDAVVELDEQFLIELSNAMANGIAVEIAQTQAQGTITNDDSATLSIDDVTQTEGDNGDTTFTFTVTLEGDVDTGFTVGYDNDEISFFDPGDSIGTLNTSGTFGGSVIIISPPFRFGDYEETEGTLTFSGQSGETQTIEITVYGDEVVELDTTFFVDLFNIQASGRNVTYLDRQGVGTIVNDDSATLSIDDVMMAEGDDGTTEFTFLVSLDTEVDASMQLDFRTIDGRAMAGEDYVGIEQSHFFIGGGSDRAHQFTVLVQGDDLLEGAESFLVELISLETNGRNVALGDSIGQGTILEDESLLAASALDGNAPRVQVTHAVSGRELGSFLAYDAEFQGGVSVSLGDVNRDGFADIITAPGFGGGPHVRVFSGLDGSDLGSFFAYDAGFLGGISVASADLNADGFADIITGAGTGGGPHVKVFSGADGSVLLNFFAFGEMFSGGVRVATGDISHDGTPDIIVAAGPGAGPHVRIFDGTTGEQIEGSLGSFYAFEEAFGGGVFVTAGYVNSDAWVDLIVSAGEGAGPHVRVFDGLRGTQLSGPLGSFYAYDQEVSGGVRVAVIDITGDGKADLITAPGFGSEPNLRAFDAASTGTLPDQIQDVLIDGFAGGVSVAAATNPATTLEPAGEELDQLFALGGLLDDLLD